MDWLRIIFDRFFGFLATIIPGCAILLLFVLHKDSAFHGFWAADALGYQTKIAILLLVTFSAGFTVQYSIGALAAGVAGAIRGALQTDKKGIDQEQVQPWRNSIWRSLLKTYLGPAAPPDTKFISQELLDKKLELISLQAGDENERINKALEAVREKSESDWIDYQWAMWWDQFHVPALLGRMSPVGLIAYYLLGNFETTGLILLIAMPWTPQLRRWWVIAFSVCWLISLIVRTAALVFTGRDAWSSFSNQIEYLRSVTTKNRREPE